MPPYRGTGQRRSGRGYIDHDIWEGLPVRHWRRQKVTVAGPTKPENAGKGNGQSELPMPKDAHLLCQMSQALLQAARAGRVNRPSPSGEEEVKCVGGDDEDGGAAAVKDESERAFMAVRWQLVPRHLEGPEVEYLAKRRKVTRSRNGGLPPGVVMKRVTVRRVDLEGNSVVEEILVAEGQPIDGEILSEVVVTEAVGTMIDGVGIVNADGVVVMGDGMQPTPPRRRPPPPKRKPKGPGRGRRRKVQFALGRDSTEGAITVDDGPIQPATVQTVVGGAKGVEVIKVDDSIGETKVKESEDTEMLDDSNLPEDEGEVEEEEEGEEGEEIEEIEDDDREEGELSPSPEPEPEPEPEPPSIPPTLASPTQPKPPPILASPTKPKLPPTLASPTKPKPPPTLASPTKPIPPPRKYSSSTLQLNPTGLTHPLPPRPESAVLFTSKPASRLIANLPPQLQQSYNDHRPIKDLPRESQSVVHQTSENLEQSNINNNNARVLDQPVVDVESFASTAVEVTQLPTDEAQNPTSTEVEVIAPIVESTPVGLDEKNTIIQEEVRATTDTVE